MAASDNRRPSGGHTLFRYTAKDIDGRTVRGTMEAADYDALYAQLLEQGLYPQRVTGRARSVRRSSATCAASFPRCSPRASVWCARSRSFPRTRASAPVCAACTRAC